LSKIENMQQVEDILEKNRKDNQKSGKKGHVHGKEKHVHFEKSKIEPVIEPEAPKAIPAKLTPKPTFQIEEGESELVIKINLELLVRQYRQRN
jgi:hypothetical protein